MIQVILGCTKDWIDEDMVEFVDIEEDFEGRDVLTYKCPICDQIHRSKRFGRG